MSETENTLNTEEPRDSAGEVTTEAAGSQEPVELVVVEGVGTDETKAEASVKRARFAPLQQRAVTAEQGTMDLLLDVRLDLRVELGRASLPVRQALQMGPGSVVTLDKLSGEAVDVLINGKLIAKGEVVVVDENFGVRVTEIIGGSAAAQVG